MEIAVPDELVERADKLRGRITRERYIATALEHVLEHDQAHMAQLQAGDAPPSNPRACPNCGHDITTQLDASYEYGHERGYEKRREHETQLQARQCP